MAAAANKAKSEAAIQKKSVDKGTADQADEESKSGATGNGADAGKALTAGVDGGPTFCISDYTRPSPIDVQTVLPGAVVSTYFGEIQWQVTHDDGRISSSRLLNLDEGQSKTFSKFSMMYQGSQILIDEFTISNTGDGYTHTLLSSK